MPSRRRLRLLLPGVLLLAGLTGAGIAARDWIADVFFAEAPGASSSAAASDGSAADADDATPLDAAARRRVNRRQRDRLPSGTSDAVAPGTGAGDTANPEIGAAHGDAPAATTDVPQSPATVPNQFVFEWTVEDVFVAEPDRDPVSEDAPVVAPATTESLAFERFVAEGVETVDGTRELVGERRPKLDDGVGVSLAGLVLGADDRQPVAGARVFITSTFYVRRYLYDHHLREVARAETDEFGAWTISHLNVDPAHFGRGGRLLVSVSAPGFASALAVPLGKVSPGVANRVQDVQLERATQTLTGIVIDEWDRKPVAGARIYATGAINPIQYPKDQRAALFLGAPTTVSGEDGRFTLEGLAKGLHTISAHGGNDCIGIAPARLPLEGEFTLIGRHIRGHIEGVCVDSLDRPIPLVTLQDPENSTHTFADGHFLFENFRGDAVVLQFAHPDYQTKVVKDIADGTTGLIVRLDRKLIEVVLDVRDIDTDAPLAHVQVTFEYPEGVAPPPKTSPHRLEQDGRYRVTLPEHAMSMALAAEGRVTETVSCAGRGNDEVIAVLLRRPE